MTERTEHRWGRVDETGTVYVRTADGERAVGQFPDGSAEEALAYFERKYDDLAGQVRLLEQRAARGASAADVAKAVGSLRSSVSSANVVGDLAALTDRLSKLSSTVDELTQEQTAQAQAAIEAAVAERTAIVAEAEALAARDPSGIQWKQAGAQLDDLFSRWQAHQRSGPRLPKKDADELWKRFRAARAAIEQGRKAFFSELDAVHRESKARKSELIRRAEALAPKGAAGVPEYRALLAEWKKAGRAGKKNDDALWARFKAAGDTVYAAKAEVDAAVNAEFEANLAAKLELLAEAEPLLSFTDREAARAKLTSIQRRWDTIGKVPREKVGSLEDRLRKVESAVRKLEDEHWNTTDPEKTARAEGLASQLTEAIAKLEDELAEARAGGDTAKIRAAEEALEARRVWLGALDR